MKDIKIPFSENGDLEIYSNTHSKINWVDNFEFRAKMKFTGISRGRSAVRFCCTDAKTGINYEMFVQGFYEMFCDSKSNRGVVNGLWGFVKRGQNYGIVYLGK